MTSFFIQFLIGNLWIAVIICGLLLAKHLLKRWLSARLQYSLWFTVLALLIVPFLPFHSNGLPSVFSLISLFSSSNTAKPDISAPSAAFHADSSIKPIQDLYVSVSSHAASPLGSLLFFVWILGIAAMLFLTVKSVFRLWNLVQAALPLQNKEIHLLFNDCLKKLKIRRHIRLYSAAYTESPFMTGIIRPRIYLPLSLISDYKKTDIYYILLHELLHYKYFDMFANYIITFSGIVYWFNPFVRYALKIMQNEREIACDSSVLNLLDASDYTNYGNALINFAEKMSLSPFPFASGIGGSKKQIKQRICGIANYRKETRLSKVRGMLAFLLIADILLGFAPMLSTSASGSEQYIFHENGKNIQTLNLNSEFEGYDGSFVLYDNKTDTWQIYNQEHAIERVSPASTYKIYDALLGLESGIITPEQSAFSWNGESQPFEAWESDQNLNSAMQNSVNWYFQTIDQALGSETIASFLQEINYGNQTIGDNTDLYWADSSLKISPVEQVELLQKFYQNDFHFSDANINAVKEAIRISSDDNGRLSGKTGTGRVDGKDVNGWFIGYIEKSGHVYYFATNIQGTADTTGSKATEITKSVLSKLQLWD